MAGVYPATLPAELSTAAVVTTDASLAAETATEIRAVAEKTTLTASTGEMTVESTQEVSASPTATLTSTPTLTPTVTSTSTSTATPMPEPTATEAVVVPAMAPDINPLTGLKASDPSVLQRLPLFVRIGNDPQIRPQSGLSFADLVYEDIMDGWWITRLTGVFLSQDLEAVGPVRSARLVNLQMVPQYKGGLVHSGASDPIRWRLSKSTIVDLDEFFHRSPYFYKEGADWRGRLFVNLQVLREYLKEESLEKKITLEGFAFDAEGSPPPAGQPVTDLTIPYPKNSVVRFKYDPASGLYQRFVQGEPHLDALTNAQLTAANVVIQFCPHNKTDIVEDSQGTTSIDIVLLGEGKVLIFRDGVVIEGRWVSQNPDRMPRFLDTAGQPIPLKPGQIWVELVPPDYEISAIPAGLLGGSTAITSTVTTTGALTPTVTISGVVTTPATTVGEADYYYSDEMPITQTISNTVIQ